MAETGRRRAERVDQPHVTRLDSLEGLRPQWQELSQRFPDDRDCLASFLVLEAAEVLEGVKPANLVKVANKRRLCGRNLYALWKTHGPALLRGSGLEARELVDRGNSVLLLLYRSDALRQLLARKSVSIILRKAGYSEPANLENTLAELQSRLAGEGFPHEIGVFLGYPLKDVIGFLGWARLPFNCQGPWKIFGDPGVSLRLAELHRHSRCKMSQQLSASDCPREWLQLRSVGSGVDMLSGDTFYCHQNDNECQYLVRQSG